MTVTNIKEVQSPKVVSLIHGVENKAVDTATPASSSEARSTGKLYATTAPKMDPSKAKETDGDYLTVLVKYLTEIILTMIELTKEHGKITESQNEVSSQYISLSKEQLKKAEKQLRKIEKAIRKAKHRSLWQKIGGAIAGALFCVIGALTADPAMFLAGAFVMSMTLSGGSEKLQAKLQSLSPELRALVLVGIAVGCAVCISMASDFVGELVAEEAAEAASAEGGAAAASSSGTSTAGVAGSISAAVNPFTPAWESFLERICHVNKKKAKEIAGILGMITALIASIGGGAAMAEAKSAQMAGKGERVTSAALNATRTTMHYTALGTNIFSSVFGILAGTSKLDQAKTEKRLGKTQKDLTIYEALLKMMGETTNQTQKAFSSLMKSFAQMSARQKDLVPSYGSEFMV